MNFAIRETWGTGNWKQEGLPSEFSPILPRIRLLSHRKGEEMEEVYKKGVQGKSWVCKRINLKGAPVLPNRDIGPKDK